MVRGAWLAIGGEKMGPEDGDDGGVVQIEVGTAIGSVAV